MPPTSQPRADRALPVPRIQLQGHQRHQRRHRRTVSGSFAEVSGLTVEVTPIEYRDGTDDTTVRKVRGLRKVSNITLKRGITGHVGFWRWVARRRSTATCAASRATSPLLNEDRSEVMRWNFRQGVADQVHRPDASTRRTTRSPWRPSRSSPRTCDSSSEVGKRDDADPVRRRGGARAARRHPVAHRRGGVRRAAHAGSGGLSGTHRGPCRAVPGIRAADRRRPSPAGGRGYFVNGGEVAYVVRLLGPGATLSTGRLDLGGGPQVHLYATSPGAWASRLAVRVIRRAIAPMWAGRGSAGRRAGRDLGSGATLATAAAGLSLVSFDIPETLPTVAVGTTSAELGESTDGDRPGTAEYRAALRGLTSEPEVALLALPDLWDRPGRGRLCAGRRGSAARPYATVDRMLVLDLPQGTDPLDAADRAGCDICPRPPPGRSPSTTRGSLCCPAARTQVVLPPGGHVAGLISRLDRERGPARTPANETLTDAVDLDRPGGTRPRWRPAAGQPDPLGAGAAACKCGAGARSIRAASGRFVAHRRLLHRLVRAARQAADPLVFEPTAPRRCWRAGPGAADRAAGRHSPRRRWPAARQPRRSGRCDGSQPARADRAGSCATIAFAPANPMEFITVRLTLGRRGAAGGDRAVSTRCPATGSRSRSIRSTRTCRRTQARRGAGRHACGAFSDVTGLSRRAGGRCAQPEGGLNDVRAPAAGPPLLGADHAEEGGGAGPEPVGLVRRGPATVAGSPAGRLGRRCTTPTGSRGHVDVPGGLAAKWTGPELTARDGAVAVEAWRSSTRASSRSSREEADGRRHHREPGDHRASSTGPAPRSTSAGCSSGTSAAGRSRSRRARPTGGSPSGSAPA